MNTPPIVSPEEWEAARQQLLVKEKELTRARDALAAERRRMPWLAVEKEYEFDGPEGKASLLDLFDGRRQLIVYRAFFEPGVSRLARACLHRLLHGGRPGRPPRPSERPRHHARVRLARAAGGHRAREGADGLGDAVVHDDGQLRRRLRRGRVARHERVHPRRRQACSAPTSSTTAATRRWGAPGATSTSPRSGARRNGRTHPTDTPRPRRTSGGTGTTNETGPDPDRRRPAAAPDGPSGTLAPCCWRRWSRRRAPLRRRGRARPRSPRSPSCSAASRPTRSRRRSGSSPARPARAASAWAGPRCSGST